MAGAAGTADQETATQDQDGSIVYNRAEIIQRIVERIGAKRYLEIGVAHAETFLKVSVDHRIGVDPGGPSQLLVSALASVMSQSLTRSDQVHLGCQIDHTDVSLTVTGCGELSSDSSYVRPTGKSSSINLYQLTSDDFFVHADRLIGPLGIDIAFVDGLHEWKQVIRDIENCLRYLNDGGVIVMHDCCPTSALVASSVDGLETARKSPAWNGAWTGDVWKAAAWLRSSRDDLNLTVLDCDWGVGLITRGKPSEKLGYSYDEIAEMTYESFNSSRSEILNLKEPSYLDNFLETLPSVARDSTLSRAKPVPA